jgi:diadenosine tetraphosphate (Ap4A) HIT family hydrolase
MEELLANTEIIIDAYDFARRLNNALKTLYGCSKVAVCMIGNLTKNEQGEITAEERYEHRHFHIIPSYPKPVERYGTIFTEDTSKNQWEMIFYFRTVQYNLKSNNSTK